MFRNSPDSEKKYIVLDIASPCAVYYTDIFQSFLVYRIGKRSRMGKWSSLWCRLNGMENFVCLAVMQMDTNKCMDRYHLYHG